MRTGDVVAAGGAGRATLLAQAARHVVPRDLILWAGAPAPTDVQTRQGLWTPEVGLSHTAIIVRDVDLLPVGRRAVARSGHAKQR